MKRLFSGITTIIFLAALLLPVGGMCATCEANHVPWSGYWWPFQSGELVRGYYPRWAPSPLAKYDYVTSGTYNGPAMRYGTDHYYDSDAPMWYGLCLCWAAASILEDEPVHKGIYEGTAFCVGDKKGLLTATYTGVSLLSYSVDNPVGLHQVLEEFIHQEGTPFIMDLGTDGEIWNYPVFEYDSGYTQDGNTRHYTVKIYYVDDNVSPDYVGTESRTAIYHYYFVMNGDEVVDSGWEDGSETNHPVSAYIPYGAGGFIDNGLDYGKVKEIVDTNGDSYEGNDSFENAAALVNGYYSLIAIGTDWFRTALEKGDTLDMRLMADVEAARWGDGGFALRIYNPRQELLEEIPVDELESGRILFEAEETGDYYLEIEPLLPSKEPFYDLSLQRILAFQGIFPLKPAGLWYTGIALLDPDCGAGRVDMTLVGEDGFPRVSYLDPSTSYLLGITEVNFGLSCPDRGYIRVYSDSPLKGLHVVKSSWDPRMSGSDIIPAQRASGDLFFPHLVVEAWKCDPRVGIINLGDQTEDVSRSIYGPEGETIYEDSIELAPGQKRVEHVSDITSGAVSMSVHATGGRDCLVGYLEFWSGPMFQYRTGALVPAPLERKTELIVPHIASGVEWPPHGYWRTDIVVMNTGDVDSQVIFTAYDDSGEEIASAAHVLKANQAFKEEAADIFPQAHAGDIASVRIISDGQLLSGFVNFRLEDGYQSAGVPMTGPGESTLYLSHLACIDSWHTGIGLMNAARYIQTEVVFSLMDATGDVLAETSRSLKPNQRFANTVKGLFGSDFSPDARYLRAESVTGQPLCGLYLMTTGAGMWMNGGVME